MDLGLFLQNPFDDSKISLGRLIAFDTDHLERMSANNASGELTARIAATTSALGLVENGGQRPNLISGFLLRHG